MHSHTENKISTVPHLPEEIETIEIKNISFAGGQVSVSHVKNVATHMVYDKGEAKLKWEAGFPGAYEFLFVDGEKVKCIQRIDRGKTCSFCILELIPGEQKRVAVQL